MSTPVQICNSALIKLGVDQFINSLSDNTKAARLCNEQYPKLRDEVLESHYWNFAMKRAELSLVVGSPLYGWTYKYQLPADCLRVKELHVPEDEFIVEDGFLLTDISGVKILYVYRNEDTSKYTPVFKELLASRIAMDLSYPIVQSVSLGDRLEKKYLRKLADARSLDAQEGFNNRLMQDTFLDSRRGGTDTFKGSVVS